MSSKRGYPVQSQIKAGDLGSVEYGLQFILESLLSGINTNTMIALCQTKPTQEERDACRAQFQH